MTRAPKSYLLEYCSANMVDTIDSFQDKYLRQRWLFATMIKKALPMAQMVLAKEIQHKQQRDAEVNNAVHNALLSVQSHPSTNTNASPTPTPTPPPPHPREGKCRISAFADRTSTCRRPNMHVSVEAAVEPPQTTRKRTKTMKKSERRARGAQEALHIRTRRMFVLRTGH